MYFLETFRNEICIFGWLYSGQKLFVIFDTDIIK